LFFHTHTAAKGNVQEALDKLLSGKPIVLPKSAIDANIPKTLLKVESLDSGATRPSLSLWINTRSLPDSKTLLAYRGTMNPSYTQQPTSPRHRWFPRLYQTCSNGKIRVFAMLTVSSRSTYSYNKKDTFSHVVLGGNKEYAKDASAMLHVAFVQDRKQVSLYVNGKLDHTKTILDNQRPWVPHKPLDVTWGPSVVGYEGAWYGESPQGVVWLDSRGATAFSDHYASLFLGMFEFLSPAHLVGSQAAHEQPTTLAEMLAASKLEIYAEKFEEAGYDDLGFVVSGEAYRGG
jgi:hypothetical protein